MGRLRRARDPARLARTIIALVGPDKRAEIARQLTAISDVDFAQHPAALLESVVTRRPHAVLLDLRPPVTPALAALLVDLVAHAAQLPVVFYDCADRHTVEMLRAVLTPGLCVDFVIRPLEPLAPTVRQLIRGPLPPLAAPVLVQHLVPLAPPSLRAFLTVAALKAPTGRGVEHLAMWSGIPLRTLEGRLSRAGWPHAQVIVQAFRALDAAWLMDEHGWSARRVQHARRLSYASDVTRLMQRYCGGLTPATLREAGGFEAAFSATRDAIVPRR